MKGLKTTLRRRLHAAMFKLPLMISCEQFEDFILAYLDDELPVKQKFMFDLHLKACRECRDYLDAYRTSIELAKQALAEESFVLPDEVPEDFIKAVLKARDK